MATYESILKFNGYIVDEITFKRNKNFKFDNNKSIRASFGITREKEIDGDIMRIKLCTTIFKDSEENNYPYEMSVTVTGIFDISQTEKNMNFESNAIAILYPYIRTIVTTYTINANVGPTILPLINVNKYIEEQEKQTKD